jgi:hypothetical protein
MILISALVSNSFDKEIMLLVAFSHKKNNPNGFIIPTYLHNVALLIPLMYMGLMVCMLVRREGSLVKLMLLPESIKKDIF